MSLIPESPATDQLQFCYERTGLVPCRCGPELRRLDDGRIACGPFVALYVQYLGIAVSAIHDDDFDRISEEAEARSAQVFGREVVAAFTAGFDREGLEQLDGVAACSLAELVTYHSGERASLLLAAIYLPYIVPQEKVHAC